MNMRWLQACLTRAHLHVCMLHGGHLAPMHAYDHRPSSILNFRRLFGSSPLPPSTMLNDEEVDVHVFLH